MPQWTNKFIYSLLVVMAITLLAGCVPFSSSHKPPAANQGILDLRNWSFNDQGSVDLKGEWEFYWERLLAPADFPLSQDRMQWIHQPRSWNGFQVNNEKISSTGFATYRLTILTEDIHRKMGIDIKTMSTAYKLWVDGKLLSSNGMVGRSKAETAAQYYPRTIYFTPDNERIELVIQVSNYKHRRGGMWENLELGTESQMVYQSKTKLAFEMFITGSLIIIGIHHIGLFSLRRRDIASLYFAAFCVIIGIRSLFVGEYFWYTLFPAFPWETGLKIEYILTYMGAPMFVRYINHLYPHYTSNLLSKMSLFLGVLFSIITLSTPTILHTKGMGYYHIIVILISAYIIYVLIIAALQRGKGSILLICGVLFLLLTIINDILYYQEVLLTGDFLTLGLFVFIFAHSLVLSLQSSKAFSDVEKMSSQLKELNSNLEQKVMERTYDLEGFNRYLTLANTELSRMETSRRHLLSNISHDLRTPITSIQGYLEAFLDGIVTAPEDQKKYMQLIHAKTLGLNRLIDDLFQLSQLEAGQISFNKQFIRIDQLLNDMVEKYETDIQRAGLHVRLHSLIPASYRMPLVSVDPGRIDQVFANLIFNAIRYTPSGGAIDISFELWNISSILIKVADTGSGIDEDKIPYIFDRFYKSSGARNTSAGGSGLGLAIAKEIMIFHDGKIWAESTPGKGSTFYLTLPVQ
jgi:signal transduction histidine kinase